MHQQQQQQQGSHISMSSSHSFSMLKTRRRNDSGELDVFDASLYFSGRADDVDVSHPRVDRRRSLDASLGAMLVHQEPQKAESAVQFKGAKKSKQPSSPGGMLASFLNSLFHQTSAKKKTKSTVPPPSFVKGDVDECKEKRSKGRRRMSSSIVLHERADDRKENPTFTQITSEEQRRCSISSSGNGNKINLQQDPFWSERSEPCTISRPLHNGANRWVLHGSTNINMLYHKDPLWAEVFMRKEEYCHGRREEEDGGDLRSESSSDLFELKNCDIGRGHLSSGGLPVYETAELCTLKRGTAVAF